MKKIVLYLFLVTLFVSAGDHDMYPQDITAVVGYQTNSRASNLENTMIHGLRYNQNIYNSSPWAIDAYQVALDIASNVAYLDREQTTSIFRLGGNLLWTMDNESNLTPFILLGAGLNLVTNPQGDQSGLSLFTNVGGGVELDIRNDIALVGEMKYIYQDPNKQSFNTNIGLKFRFGN